MNETSSLQTPPLPADRSISRVRHAVRIRLLTVSHIVDITPRMRRITLAGGDLAGFASPGFDDHVKLFPPLAGADAPVLPDLGPDGRITGGPITARDYTPRRFDPERMELDLDFALHEAGPATAWALRARPGDQVGVGGPKGSFLIGTGFAWHLLIGDETALPAIGRRLAELPAGTRALVIAEVADAGEEQRFETRADAAIVWLHRNGAPAGTTEQLDNALRALALPPGEGHAWVACESATAKRLRQILVEDRGLPRERVKASGYWRRGSAGFHETHGD